MIPISGMKSARPADIKGAHLVAYKSDQRFALALSVSLTKEQGVLPLRAQPLQFLPSNTHCLDIGQPIFQWSGNEGISDSAPPTSTAGYLIVLPDARVLITGLAIDQICQWDLATGQKYEAKVDTAIYLSKWTLGMKDASGQFQQLFKFEPPARS